MKNAYTYTYKMHILHSFLTKYKILFRNNHSTIHALICLVDLIKKHVDNDYLFWEIFIDLQKASGIVNQDILLAKRAHYGISGFSITWLSSF